MLLWQPSAVATLRAGVSLASKVGRMEHPGFFERAAPVRLDDLAQKVGAQLAAGRRSRPAHP